MRSIFLLLTLIISTAGFAQKKSIEQGIKDVKTQFQSMDSLKARLDSQNNDLSRRMTNASHEIDSILKAKEIERLTENSANYFGQLSRERNAAAKKKMWLYLFLGGGGLVILVIGMMRKKKNIS